MVGPVTGGGDRAGGGKAKPQEGDSGPHQGVGGQGSSSLRSSRGDRVRTRLTPGGTRCGAPCECARVWAPLFQALLWVAWTTCLSFQDMHTVRRLYSTSIV